PKPGPPRPLPPLPLIPAAVLQAMLGGGVQLAFGKYVSPDYETAGQGIPPVGTPTGVPTRPGPQGSYFNLILPARYPPPQGWPVAIFGPGSGGNKVGSAPFILAAELAAHGIATIGINAVGHGYGPLGTLTVTLGSGETVTFSAGGRGVDR